jgi:hypothetical protein
MRLVGQLSLGCHRDALLVHLIPRAAKMAGRCVGLIPSRRPKTHGPGWNRGCRKHVEPTPNAKISDAMSRACLECQEIWKQRNGPRRHDVKNTINTFAEEAPAGASTGAFGRDA